MPLATAIGNHESLSADYSYHYYTPNAADQLGSTASGSDYYFNYGSTLFIVLNSNNRNAAEHDQLMQKAISDPASANAKWKIAVMHHDIYGTGAPHSDVDGANLRSLFAPLMDKYQIDACLTGHDHSYCRTYQILDGKAVDYETTNSVNPQGTLYMAFNSATGSKYYELNTTQQYYVSKRSQLNHQNYSVLSVTGDTLSVKTYDATDNSQLDTYSIQKTSQQTTRNPDLLQTLNQAAQITAAAGYSTAYTADSRTALENAMAAAANMLDTLHDAIPADFYGNYDKSVQGSNPNDILNYYAYDTVSGKRVAAGYCSFLDKTMDSSQSLLTKETVAAAETNLEQAISGLVKDNPLLDRLYQTVLGRQADAAGYQNWSTGLDNGKTTGAEAAVGFYDSTELTGKNLSDQEYITLLYEGLLNREPDAAGLACWLQTAASGVTRNKLLEGFLNTPEFTQMCEACGVRAGSYVSSDVRDINPQVSAFAARLYEKCLGRSYDTEGLLNWVTALVNHEISGRDAVMGFMGSPEFRQKALSNEQIVTVLYQTMLNREPDPAGWNTWVSLLNGGIPASDIVLEGFGCSAEFAGLCADYGINAV